MWSVINGILFNGQEILAPTMLEDYDSDTSTYVENHQIGIIGINRNRDIIKKVNIDGKMGLIAIENQSHVDRRMLYRIREYDSYTCLNQYYYQQSQSKSRKKLLHIMTLVLYFGSKPWKGARTFNELALQPPSSLESFMNYPMVPIVCVTDLDYHMFHHYDNLNLIRGLQIIYRFNGNIEMLKGMIVSKIVASLLALFSDDEELFEMIQIQSQEEINMCESIRKFKEDNIRQGKIEGKIEGRMEGRIEGHMEGRIEGQVELLIEILQYKLKYLSQETIFKLQNSSEQQLKELSKHIFEIQDEKEVTQILVS